MSGMTIKEAQYLIKHIELGTLENVREKTLPEKKENTQRLVLKLIEEFGELAENIRKDVRYTGEDIKGTIEEERVDIFYDIIAIANNYNINLEEIFYIKDQVNMKKYKRKFSLDDAREEYKKESRD